MLIGVPKETKNQEYRVSISPFGVKELVNHGHQVFVEGGAGAAIGYTNAQYEDAGAKVLEDVNELYDTAELIVKVKEPQASECRLIRKDQIIFSYLHLVADPLTAESLIDSGCIAIAYETVEGADGSLPLLAPMSEIAGKLSVQAGAHALEKGGGGRGVLLGGIPGVAPAKVVIIGAGSVGVNACSVALGMGARVVVLDNDIEKIRLIDEKFSGGQLQSIYATGEVLQEHVVAADLVVGAVHVPGASSPKVLTSELVQNMMPGSVFVDVAIDQGGCSETSRPTTHERPVYMMHDVVHYCVTNIPSSVAWTASRALENALLPYILKLANKGCRNALKDDELFRKGVNIYKGRITHEMVARELKHSYVPPTTFLS
jgi:alanine dehydrogenase